MLPKPARQGTSDQHARRETQAHAGQSNSQGPAGAADSRRTAGKGVSRRKGRGKGRMMMSASTCVPRLCFTRLGRDGFRSLMPSLLDLVSHSQDLLRPQLPALPFLVRTNTQLLLAPPARLDSLVRLPRRPRPLARPVPFLALPCTTYTRCTKLERGELLVHGEVVGAGLGPGYRQLVRRSYRGRQSRSTPAVWTCDAQDLSQRDLHLSVRKRFVVILTSLAFRAHTSSHRPELVIDSTKDFSVSAVDPYESSQRRQPASGSGTSSTFAFPSTSTAFETSSRSPDARPGEGLVEGKGMLSWTLAEKKEGTTMVVGRIVGSADGGDRRNKRREGDDGGFAMDEMDEGESDTDEPEETLEVWLQLSEVSAFRPIARTPAHAKPSTQRDAFTQGQFLDCLRSYHNPVQHLQSEMSDFASSPPKRRESALFASTSSAHANRPASGAPVPSGDPVKRKRPRETPSLPIPSVATSIPPAPFVTGASSPAPFLPFPPAGSPANDAGLSGLQDPKTLTLLGQILPSLTAAGGDASGLLAALSRHQQQHSLAHDGSAQSQQEALLPAIQTLAKFCGIDLPAQQPLPTEPLLTSTAADPSSFWQSELPRPPTAVPSNPPPAPASRKSKAGATSSASSHREHFAAIDLTSLSASHAQAVGKQNPRNPQGGCANCKRRKSTTWREGKGPDGKLMSVCNGQSRSRSLSFAEVRTLTSLATRSLRDVLQQERVPPHQAAYRLERLRHLATALNVCAPLDVVQACRSTAAGSSDCDLRGRSRQAQVEEAEDRLLLDPPRRPHSALVAVEADRPSLALAQLLLLTLARRRQVGRRCVRRDHELAWQVASHALQAGDRDCNDVARSWSVEAVEGRRRAVQLGRRGHRVKPVRVRRPLQLPEPQSEPDAR